MFIRHKKGDISLRLLIEFDYDRSNYPEIRLPIHYNYLLQGMIYRSLEAEFAKNLHDRGFPGGGRFFKLFTFSRLIGEYRMAGKEIRFKDKIRLIVSSPVDQFCQSLLNGLLSRGMVQLGPMELIAGSIRADKPQVDGELLKIKTLSPVIAYSTLLKPDGGKYTCYFQPGEKEFTRIAGENLRKKYQALFNREAPVGEIGIRTLQPPRMHVLEYKGLVVKGYTGMLEIKGPKELLQVALDVGVGSKNSMGFGCAEKV
jgi:CRISPR-associated endoribonuclease Cas6